MKVSQSHQQRTYFAKAQFFGFVDIVKIYFLKFWRVSFYKTLFCKLFFSWRHREEGRSKFGFRKYKLGIFNLFFFENLKNCNFDFNEFFLVKNFLLNVKMHECFKSIFCFVASLKISFCYISFVLNSTNHLLPVLNHSPKSSCFLWSPVEYWLIPTFTKKLSVEQILDIYAFCSREKKTATNGGEINGTAYSRLLKDICTKVKSKMIGIGNNSTENNKSIQISTIN